MQRVIIILGMHRSGTSCLTGILGRAGVALGKVAWRGRFNTMGSRENSEIFRLNENVLNENNFSWHNPPQEKIEWPVYLKEKRDLIISKYKKYPLWGFKDPRTLFTLDGWLESIPSPIFLGTYRNPLSVANSLLVRNNFPLDKSLELWRLYNTRLIQYYDIYRFPIISFDLPEHEYKEKIKNVFIKLGIRIGRYGLNFYSLALKHHEGKPNDVCLPNNVRQIYERLQDISRQEA